MDRCSQELPKSCCGSIHDFQLSLIIKIALGTTPVCCLPKEVGILL